MPSETIELTQAAPSEEESTTVERGSTDSKAGRKPESAYRAAQSRADRAESEANRLRQQDMARQAEMAQIRRQMEDLQYNLQWSQLPDDERQRNQAILYQQRQQQAVQELQTAYNRLQYDHNSFLNQTGRIAALTESIVKHRPPAEVMGKPIMRFLLQHTQDTQSVEEMDALVAQVAAEFGGGKSAATEAEAKAKAKPRAQAATDGKPKPSKYVDSDGVSVGRRQLGQLTEAEQKEVWDRLGRGELSHADLRSGRF